MNNTDQTDTAKRGRRPWRSRVAIGVTVFLSVTAALLVSVYWTNNFHVVQDKVVYRSAQPNARELTRYVQQYGIKSVINLRGGVRGQAWYDEEHDAASTAGVTVFDFPLSARRGLTPGETQQLVAIMQLAPKPLLIHCKHGADRSGLAAALFLRAVMNADADTAARQLSFMYGHLPYLGNATVAMDDTYWRYVKDQTTSTP